MFNLKELKQKIEKTDDIVECPVNGCKVQVKRMNNRDQKKLYSYIGTEKDKMKEFEKYFCKAHKIYITPTTFIYKYFEDNSLWYDDGDKALLKGIFKVKRIKSQLFHHNSEDAVTWNVFRFLEITNLLSGFLTNLQNSSIKNQEIIYWSYAQSQKGLWDMLEKARKEFELVPSKGSEPDLIILCRNILLIIEAKLMDKNENGAKPRVEDKYVNGGQRWWDEVFCSDFKTVAIKEKKYELSRLWLIGTWIANQLNLDFYLVNLMLEGRKRNMEGIFKKHIKENQHRKFIRINWEDIYQYISNSSLQSLDKTIILKYFKNKTIYDTNGKLQTAFSIP